jgi:hypothetical protein
MFVPKFIKDDWVRMKGSTQLMQIEEYQTEVVVEVRGGKEGGEYVHRQYNGKVWCTWNNQNTANVIRPFAEVDLELVIH